MITIDEIRDRAKLGKAPRLKTLARFINANFPQYQAKMEDWWGRWDTRIPGTRLIHKGKYIECKKLVVYDRESGRKVLDHNPTEAYRRNVEVSDWIIRKWENK